MAPETLGSMESLSRSEYSHVVLKHNYSNGRNVVFIKFDNISTVM